MSRLNKKIFKKLFLFLFFALYFVSCAKDHVNMKSGSAKIASEPSPQTQDVDPNANSNNSETIRTITSSDHIKTEFFQLADIEKLSESFEVPAEPLGVKSFTWTPPSSAKTSFNVIASANQTKNLVKKAPLRYSNANYYVSNSINYKHITVVAVIDTSESSSAAVRNYSKSALNLIASNLYNADTSSDKYEIEFRVCGLAQTNGSTPIRYIYKGSQSLSSFQSAVNTAADQLFATGGVDTERSFYSLYQCIKQKALTADTTLGLFIATDAPNCKDNNNVDAPVCNRTSGQPDNHLYLINNYLGAKKHQTVFGALYRKANNASICSGSDDVEVPNSNENFYLNSQFADAANAFMNNAISGYPFAISGYSTLTGDICASSFQSQAVNDFSAFLKFNRDTRFTKTQSNDTFDVDDQYNMKVTSNGVAINFAVKDGIVVAELPRKLDAVYHQKQGYDNLNYANALSPKPTSGAPVVVKWGGATPGQTNCPEASSFSGLPTNTLCRWSGTNLVLANLNFLPAVDPVNTQSITFTVEYINEVPKIRSFEFSANDPIFLSTVKTITYPAGAASQANAATVSLSADGKTATVNYGNQDLVPGQYEVSYIPNSEKTFDIGSTVSGTNDSYKCHEPNATAKLAGDLVSVEGQLPLACSLDGDRRTIRIRGKENASMAFKVSYKATITPLNDVTLKITPESGSVYISIVNMLTGAKRPDDQSGFQVLGSNVVFNQSIKPGEYVRVNYEKKPALGSPNFVLSGKAYDGKYYVKFGPVGSERNLLKDFDYVVGEQGDVALINLDPLRVLIDYGNRLIVEYQYSSERSEDTKTK